MLAVSKTQALAEEQMRSSIKAQTSDIHLQLSAMREMLESLSAGSGEAQEDRDLGQDEKIESLRAGLAQVNARLQTSSDEHEGAREKLHKALLELSSQHGLHKEDTAEKLAALGIAAEALRENFQSRLASTDQHVQDVRVQVPSALGFRVQASAFWLWAFGFGLLGF
jgi:hypothetical protein